MLPSAPNTTETERARSTALCSAHVAKWPVDIDTHSSAPHHQLPHTNNASCMLTHQTLPTEATSKDSNVGRDLQFKQARTCWQHTNCLSSGSGRALKITQPDKHSTAASTPAAAVRSADPALPFRPYECMLTGALMHTQICMCTGYIHTNTFFYKRP